MRLKALEVQGFKTFPDKTKLNFTEGITAVVGPNGSGKSNISDAIRWVLGEQSAKALRCSRMEDVIFNGTRQRKKTGYAQVTLSFDNSDRLLQFDSDELSVTRRYYRSGNSEYLINNTVVRLQDIHELFMDTGLGRDGYSMIGQGKIDSIVATRGEDRREIFEEAAGISKFRYKKADAERRLEKTEDNLVRLRDIISVLEGRVGPLKEQSEKAKAYLGYAEEKRGLEIALWLRTLDKSASSVREQEDKIAVAKSDYEDASKALEALVAEGEKISDDQNAYSIEMEELRRRISEKEELISQQKSEAAVIQSDIRHNGETQERINSEIMAAESSGQELTEYIAEQEKKVGELEKGREEQTRELQRCTDELLKLKTGEDASAEKLERINSALSELTTKSSDAKIRFITSSSSVEELSGRMEVVESTIKARRSQTETLGNIISDYKDMVSDCDENLEKVQGERENIEKERLRAEGEIVRIKDKAEKLDLSAKQMLSKAKMLEELERNLEGFLQSVKLVIREAKNGQLKGIRGPVSRVIRTPSQYSTAIETALGAAMQNIVVETDKDAKDAIAFLKRKDGGRATFLPMSTIKGRELRESGLENCEGFVGIASELCTADECYSGILSNLLGRIVVAQDLDRAVDIAKKYSYRFRVVTLDGQVVNAGGSLTGGSLTKNAGLLSRTAEIESLRKQAEETSQRVEKGMKLLEEKQEELSGIQTRIDEKTAEADVIKSDKIKLEAEIRSRENELEVTRNSLREAEKERQESLEKMNSLTEAVENARKELDVYRKSISENEEQARSLSGSKDEFVRQRESLTEELQGIKIRLLTIEKDIDSKRSEIENAGLRRASAEEKIRQSRAEIEELKKATEALRKRSQELQSSGDVIREEISSGRKRTEEIAGLKMALEKKFGQLRTEERELTSRREAVGGELSRLEERRVNLQKQYDDILSKLWDEYELTKKEAEDCAAEIEDTGKAQRRLSELKQKIKALGAVNVAAIEEYKEVSREYEFLTKQVGDVEKSRAELLRLITELTKQMREIFLDRFSLINRNFSDTFKELFGGGKASLSLTDPENILTTGIEISVEPPGKLVSHIELLSGGEKALVAIALYFAIMKVRPAPFCVMDEIEAALDDVNVYRFAEYLRRMNDKTQFICITHRRGTMEEADVLYGVTMQDQGISKLLELKASEIEKQKGFS